MAPTTTAPIKNGIVRRLRSSTDLRTAIKGGIHERLAPKRVRYPFIVFSEAAAPMEYTWGSEADGGTREIHALYDISVFSLHKVEAQNLDSLIDGLFSGPSADLDLDEVVVGQHVILCRRTANMPTGPDRDDEGRRIVQFGGQYEIWTSQPMIEPTPPPPPPGP